MAEGETYVTNNVKSMRDLHVYRVVFLCNQYVVNCGPKFVTKNSGKGGYLICQGIYFIL